MNSEEWTKYYDEKTNSYYWYSNKTGESFWDEENKEIELSEIEGEGEGEREEGEGEGEKEEEIRPPRNPHAHDYSDEEDDENEEEVYEEKQNQNNNKNKLLTNVKDQENQYYSDEDNNSDDDEENFSNEEEGDENDQLISNLIKKDVLYKTQQDITIFTYCFIIHAIIIEAPLCIIESFLRSFLFFIFCCFFFILFLLTLPYSIFFRNQLSKQTTTTSITTSLLNLPPLLSITLFLLLESLLSFSLGFSFFIPGLILLIYRDFNGVDDWKLHPMPSVVGWIDPRRLAVITLGQGSSAVNASVQWKLVSTSNNISAVYLSDKRIEIMDSLKYNLMKEPTIFTQPFCFPRDLLSFLRSNH